MAGRRLRAVAHRLHSVLPWNCKRCFSAFSYGLPDGHAAMGLRDWFRSSRVARATGALCHPVGMGWHLGGVPALSAVLLGSNAIVDADATSTSDCWHGDPPTLETKSTSRGVTRAMDWTGVLQYLSVAVVLPCGDNPWCILVAAVSSELGSRASHRHRKPLSCRESPPADGARLVARARHGQREMSRLTNTT